MNRNLLIGLGAFLAVVVVGFFLVKKPTTSAPPAQPTASPSATQEVSPSTEVTITGTEYVFNPASIVIKKGEKVRLTFVNAGTTLHDLAIDKLGVKTKMVAPGKSDTIEFTAEEAGNLTFYCSVSNHQELGMEGKLKIEQ